MTDDRTPVTLSPEEYLNLGQRAFENGQYRSAIEALIAGEAINGCSVQLDGELKTWRVMALEAIGDRESALELCRKVAKHPHSEARQQGKQLLYILEAPKLRMKSEWLTEIPDLSKIESTDEKSWNPPPVNAAPKRSPRPKKPEGYVIPEPTDPTKVNMGDDRSMWFALGAAIAVVLGLLFIA